MSTPICFPWIFPYKPNPSGLYARCLSAYPILSLSTIFSFSVLLLLLLQVSSQKKRMTIQTTQTPLSPIFEGDEIQVCIILEDLENIIRQSEFQSLSKLLVTWSGKRRRSKRVSPVASCAVVVNSPAPPHKVSHGDNEIQTAEQKVKQLANSSPATPLSFSPSESDEKQKQKRSSRKRMKKKKKVFTTHCSLLSISFSVSLVFKSVHHSPPSLLRRSDLFSERENRFR